MGHKSHQIAFLMAARAPAAWGLAALFGFGGLGAVAGSGGVPPVGVEGLQRVGGPRPTGELAKHAVSERTKTVTKYTSSK